MRATEKKLIAQLQEFNADRQHATTGGFHPRKPVPPATKATLKAAEQALGFKLPELLRAVYLQVANGGFGAGYGIVGLKGGVKHEGCTLETAYPKQLKLVKENPVWRWPPLLLPLANLGCGMWSCVDCEYQKLPIILWEPNNLDETLTSADAQMNWGNSFWDEGLTLKSWLTGCLDENQPWPEPKWPSDAWMKRRLGFTLSK